MTLKTLFVSDATAVGGSEVYLREMLPRIAKFGIESTVALPKSKSTVEFIKQLRGLGLTVHVYDHLSSISDDADMVFASTWKPFGYKKYHRLFKKPFVAIVHDQLMLHIPGLPQSLYKMGYKFIQGVDIKKAGEIITVSEWGSKFLQQHYGAPKVWTIKNGVDTQKFSPASPEKKEELRQLHGFRRYSVLVPARLSFEKNHLTVLNVAKLMPHVDFFLVGDGDLAAVLKAMAPDNVKLLGRRWDMPDLYRACDAVLQPTFAENQSLATLEAMASGLPVVTNNIPAQRELIGHHETGVLVNNSARNYAEALQYLMAHPGEASRIGEGARAYVCRNHTIEQAAEKLAQVIKEFVSKSKN